MHLDVMGLGYVGSVVLLHLSEQTDKLSGIDICPNKVEAFKNGQLSIFEPDLHSLLRNLHQKGQSRFCTSLPATRDTDHRFYIICVGSPQNLDGSVNLEQVHSVMDEVALAIKSQPQIHHTVVLRSTVPPKTCREQIIPSLEKESGQSLGLGFNFYFFPEFLREGSALKDIKNPSLFVVGAPGRAIDHSDFKFFELFPGTSNLTVSTLETSEMIKYLNNSFHALKAGFVNEVASIAEAHSVPIDELFKIFQSDEQLNISKAYLNPGFAFGGTCLTKEIQALNFFSLNQGLRTPLLENLLPSNDEHILRFVSKVESLDIKSIGFVGVTFKPDTDDTRESPLVTSLKMLKKRRSYQAPYKIYVFDRLKTLDKIQSEFIDDDFYLTDDFQGLVDSCDTIVLGPARLNSDNAQMMKEFTGKILDLKWHPLSEPIHHHENYISFP